jgi:hypothetical protein
MNKRNDEDDLYTFLEKYQYRIFGIALIISLLVGYYDYEKTCQKLNKDLTVIEYIMLDKKSI